MAFEHGGTFVSYGYGSSPFGSGGAAIGLFIFDWYDDDGVFRGNHVFMLVIPIYKLKCLQHSYVAYLQFKLPVTVQHYSRLKVKK